MYFQLIWNNIRDIYFPSLCRALQDECYGFSVQVSGSNTNLTFNEIDSDSNTRALHKLQTGELQNWLENERNSYQTEVTTLDMRWLVQEVCISLTRDSRDTDRCGCLSRKRQNRPSNVVFHQTKNFKSDTSVDVDQPVYAVSAVRYRHWQSIWDSMSYLDVVWDVF